MIFRPIIPIWLMIIIVFLLGHMAFKKRTHIINHILIIILLFTINLRPSMPNGKLKKYFNNINIIFVVDNTLSMYSLDYNQNNTRMYGARTDIEYIVNKLPNSFYSLITFDNDSKLIIPSTKDAEATIIAMNTLRRLYVDAANMYLKGVRKIIVKQ